MSVQIEQRGPALSEEQLRAFEKRIGVELPGDYRAFMLESNGGVPTGAPVFAVPGRRLNEQDTISCFNFIDSGNPNVDVELTAQLLAGRIPDDTIPIADCGCGDTVLLSVRGSRRGEVLMWDHEGEGDPDVSNVYVIAPSFTQFIDGLYENPA